MGIQWATLKHSRFNSAQLIVEKLINVLERNREEFMIPELSVNWNVFEYKYPDNLLFINGEYIRNDLERKCCHNKLF